MPFKSDKQRKYLWRNVPEVAKKFASEEKKPAPKKKKKEKKDK